MTDRCLSSSQTFYLKVILPVLWIGGFVTATISMFMATRSGARDPDLLWMRWVFLVITILGGTFLVWFAARLKRV